jgi:hypothetical protein
VIHLLLSLFCCGLWLPIWILHTLFNSASSEPFLCSQCGQRAEKELGRSERQPTPIFKSPKPTPQEVELARRERAVLAGARKVEKLKNAADSKKQFSSFAVLAFINEMKVLPFQIDRALRFIAGEGNDIIFWFLRIVTVLLATGFFIGVVWAGFTFFLNRLP